MADLDVLASWLQDRWADLEQMAIAATGYGDERSPDGEHWLWMCNTHDIEAVPGDDGMYCPQCQSTGDVAELSLRSVERYPTDPDDPHPLPHFVVPGAWEMTNTDAAHLARWDPVAVLADLASKRALLADLMAEWHTCAARVSDEADCTCGLTGSLLHRLRILASPFAGRDDMPAELREETRG